MKRIFIIAGDSSGDLHSSKLMKEMKVFDPDIEFFGIGGDYMAQEGLTSLVPLNEISVVGFWEVAKKYLFFKKLINQVQEKIENLKIDLFIAVDYPGFNQRIAKFAKEKGIPVVWYIAPQLWAWGKNRALKLSKIIDDLLVVFPFEKEFFENFGISTHFVGHPLLDIPEFQKDYLNSNLRKNQLLFMPGSRLQEIKSHLPLILQVHELIQKRFPEFKSIIALPQSLIESVSSKIGNYHNLEITNDSKKAMLTSKAGMIKSGTSNLEACLAGLPFAMFYKTSALTFYLGKRMINLNFLSLVNILAGKQIIREFIQKDAKPEIIFSEIEKIILDKEYSNNITESFSEIRSYLGNSGASKRAAELIFKKYLRIDL